MSVEQIERLDQKEIMRWRAMAQLEPFGAAAEDYRFGQLLATKYGGHPLKYFPGHDEEEAAEILKVLTMEEIKSRMQRGFKKE